MDAAARRATVQAIARRHVGQVTGPLGSRAGVGELLALYDALAAPLAGGAPPAPTAELATLLRLARFLERLPEEGDRA